MKTIYLAIPPICKLLTQLSCIYCFFVASASATPIAGDLIISEVLANPSAVSDTHGEWFEIFNTSENGIDLSGVIIRDEGPNQHTVSSASPLFIEAQEYFVFGRNGNSTDNGNYNADYVYSNFTLGNTSDEIILELDGIIIASLFYNDNALFGSNGNSAEFNGVEFRLTSFDWVFGDGDVGTPGTAGSVPLAIQYDDDDNGEVNSSVNVPEPATLWLFCVGLTGLISARRINDKLGLPTSDYDS